MNKYVKKPVQIEAIQLLDTNIFEVVTFIDKEPPRLNSQYALDAWGTFCTIVKNNGLSIDTLEGEMTARIGDYVIRGVKDEVYPCKPDIFELTYDKVE